jgi:hypothetical protein
MEDELLGHGSELLHVHLLFLSKQKLMKMRRDVKGNLYRRGREPSENGTLG